MLSPLDDYPVHQIPHPLRYVATSDRNFYDRYYFCVEDINANTFMVIGFGVYPNLGVADAFAAFRQDDDYVVVRASKQLGDDRADLEVGPFHIEITEGLKRLRVRLLDNEWGLTFDLAWTGATAPYLESPRFRRDTNGRITHDQCRFNQVGTWNGAIQLGEMTIDVAADRWTGARDRSWGIRPVGDPEPERMTWRDPGSVPSADHFWIYAPLLFDDFSLHIVIEERPDGTRTLEDAVRVPSDGGAPVALGSPSHNLEFVPGTRRVKHATITLSEPDGSTFDVHIEPRQWIPIFLGTGYRAQDHWRHGKNQGALAVEGLRYDVSDPGLENMVNGLTGIIDSAARATIGTMTGSGLFEFGVFGTHDRYGFVTPQDVAGAS